MSDWTPVAVPKLSPSTIGTFNNCPLQFKYQKIDGRYGPGSEATVRGSFVHEVLEYLFKEKPEDRTALSAREIATDRWNNAIHKYSRKTWEEQARAVGVTDFNDFKYQAWWNVETYFKMEDPTTVDDVALESWVNGPIVGVELRGIIDRIDNDDDGERLVIVDYKTGKSHQKGSKYEAGKIFPLMVYAELTEEGRGKPVSRMELLFVSDGTRVAYEPTAEYREAMYKTVHDTHEEMSEACTTGEFEARKSKLCDWCDFKPECPAWS